MIAAALLNDEPGSRCGWSGSSPDLKQGLQVSELMDDAVTALWVMAGGPQLH